jgi:glycosyltransferase involved in cell wall biosynthesis
MNDGELADRLRAAGLPVIVLPESKLNALQILVKLIRIIREFKPDILHTHRQKENILGNIANLIAKPLRKARAKSVRTAHGAPEFAPKGKQKIQVWLDQFIGKHLQETIIAVSQELAEKLKLIYSTNKIHVVYNGADVDALEAQAGIADFKSTNPTTKHIGIIGRLEPVKRIDIFLAMAAELIATASSSYVMHFHVIGDGKLRSDMEKLAIDLGIQAQVSFHGHRKDMPSCIKSLDCIVMCSDHEGTPMTALEAMVLGTPMVAHSVGGLKELLANYPYHFLTESHTASSYANLVRDALNLNEYEHSYPNTITAQKNSIDTLAIYSRT